MTRESAPCASRSTPAASADTVELISRWQEDHDFEARDQLVEQYRSLVRKLARRYINPHEPLEDIIQVAMVGLLLAIDRFDTRRGTPFSAYAIPTILGEIKRYFRDTGWVAHVPRGAQEMALRVDSAVSEMATRTGESPRVEAIAEYLEIGVADVLMGLDAGGAHFATSLDAPAGGRDDEEGVLQDRVGADDENFALVDAKLSYSAAIARLPHVERQVLRLRIESDLKQTEIAQQLGCSQMQVSRLLRRASESCRRLLDPEVDGPD